MYSPADAEPPWWHESAGYFDGNYLEELRDPNRYRKGELDFYLRVIHKGPPSSILDLGGGWGRLAIPLSLRGHRVTLLDSSRSLLDRGRVASHEARAILNFEHADMRSFAAGLFDTVICNSFAYFDDDRDYYAVLRRVYESLVPNGQLLIDLQNWEHVRATFRAVESRAGPNGSLSFARELDEEGMSVCEQVTRSTKEYGMRTNTIKLRYFDASIAQVLANAGLTPREIYGDYDSTSHGPDSPRLILDCRKCPPRS